MGNGDRLFYMQYVERGNKRMSYYGSSKNSHEHGGTPEEIYNYLKHNGYEISDFDPCPNNPEFDGLEIEWPHETIYVNPPYSRGQLSKWVKKCYDEYRAGKTIIMLIPSYTDTRYFHKYIYNIARLEFIKGRLKFKGYNGKASFPSMLVYFEGGCEDE